MTNFDQFDLAAAIRDAGIAQGGDALDLAADIVMRLCAPTPKMVCEAALDRAATTTGLDEYCE
jgi:hypothetical protein